MVKATPTKNVAIDLFTMAPSRLVPLNNDQGWERAQSPSWVESGLSPEGGTRTSAQFSETGSLGLRHPIRKGCGDRCAIVIVELSDGPRCADDGDEEQRGENGIENHPLPRHAPPFSLQISHRRDSQLRGMVGQAVDVCNGLEGDVA